MNVCSIPYLAFVGALAVACPLLPGARWRRALFSAVNLGFLVPFLPNLGSAACLAVFVVGTYAAVRLTGARPSRASVALTLTAAVAAFLYLKRYTFLAWALPRPVFDHALVVVGLSYMLFKFIHVLVDYREGQIERLDFVSYANYLLAFFTLLAGPIQRYNDFRTSWDEMAGAPEGPREAWLSWSRALTGIVKMGAAAPLAWLAFEEAGSQFLRPAGGGSLWWFSIYFYAYPVYLYLNFSGYTDIAIGSGRLLGFKPPENFNRPYLARNINDFWNRWHMTLTHWVRDYLFMTSYKAAAERFPRWHKAWGYLLLLTALFVAGVWHGSTSGFAVFGLLQGFGAAVGQVYGDRLRTALGRAGFQRYLGNRWIECAAVLATLNYVCFTMLFFSSGTRGAVDVLHALAARWGAAGQASPPPPSVIVGLASVTVVALALGILWAKNKVFPFLDRVGRRFSEQTRYLPPIVVGQAVLAVFLLVFFWAVNQKDPVVVYMRF